VELWALTVFVGTLLAVGARQLLGRGPPLWTIFLGGGAVTVLTGVLSFPQASATLSANLPVFGFLFALFVFAGALDSAGALEHLARWILGRAADPADLPLYLFIGFGLLSAVLLNDAVVLIGVPLVLSVARRIGGHRHLLLLTLAFSVTVGSVLTPMGNPQNLLVAIGSGLPSPVGVFLRYLAIPTALNLLLGGLYLRWEFGRRFRSMGGRRVEHSPRIPFWPKGGWWPRFANYPALIVFPVTMAGIFGTDLLAEVAGVVTLPVYEVALLGAVVVLLLTPGRPALLARVDWSILLLFAGLFVVVAGALNAGILGGFESLLRIPGPGASRLATVGTLVGSSLIGSQLVSNVPWTALQISALHSLGFGPGQPIVWVALAAGSTLGGNLTFLGAASNLIVVEKAESAGLTIKLSVFVRYGLPLTALTVTVLFVCLLLGL
jgi:Na+/H+ antiporter NhaD/arsenite permease-like protein